MTSIIIWLIIVIVLYFYLPLRSNTIIKRYKEKGHSNIILNNDSIFKGNALSTFKGQRIRTRYFMCLGWTSIEDYKW